MRYVNDRRPNFYGDDGQLYLVRCFACGGDRGTENWSCAVATGCCAFCGWQPNVAPEDSDDAVRCRRDDQLRQLFE